LRDPLYGADAPRIQPEPILTRAEAVQAIFAVYDLLVEVRRIRLLLDDDYGEEEEEDLGE
jgi:hypothetical protein